MNIKKEGKDLNNIKSYSYPNFDSFGKHNDFEFRNVVTFGDSLSDSGSMGRGAIYMADGNPFTLYNSLLSVHLSGKFNAPVRRDADGNISEDGVNWAISGARAKGIEFLTNPVELLGLLGDPIAFQRSWVSKQIDSYLDYNLGKADPDSIYILWAGGNDMTGDTMSMLFPWNWNTILTTKNYINSSPTYLVTLADKLMDHGAGNIFINNLPDHALSPFSGVALWGMTMGGTGISVDGTPMEDWDLGHLVLRKIDHFLRDQNNLVTASNVDEYYIQNYVNAWQAVLPFVPSDLFRLMVKVPMILQREVVERWNHDMEESFRRLNGDRAIYFDIYALTQDINKDFKSYGIDNILVPQCELGYQSTGCDAGDDYYYGDDGVTYMYTDWHHPSPMFHRIISEYMLNVFNAPGYYAGLSRNMELNNDARDYFMTSELKSMRSVNDELYRTKVFASLIGGSIRTPRMLNSRGDTAAGIGVGAAYRAFEGFDVGVSLAATIGKKNPSYQMNYSDQATMATMFLQYVMPEGFWFNTTAFAGHERMKNINRLNLLGKKLIVETGDTTGNFSGASASLGWDIPFEKISTCCQQWYVSPYIEGVFTKYKVKGYDERGDRFTAFSFSDHTRKVKTVKLGTQLISTSEKVNTNLDLGYVRKIDEEPLVASGQLKSLRERDLNSIINRSAAGISKKSKGYFEIAPSVEYKFDQKSSVYFGVKYRYGKNKHSSVNGSLGFRKTL